MSVESGIFVGLMFLAGSFLWILSVELRLIEPGERLASVRASQWKDDRAALVLCAVTVLVPATVQPVVSVVAAVAMGWLARRAAWRVREGRRLAS